MEATTNMLHLLHQAEDAAGLSFRERELRIHRFVGALSALCPEDVWREALNSSYGYIESKEPVGA